ncbi:hypothetical protein FSP39_012976 [Pinctada imbricata]|uniref:Peptidase M14 domain-containing protein n=1 Tax=Pinctada imbricata TaxID=66713 RepID=A0AA88XFG6_PINIB|nr:hypothetical protein FSP39_012976 [Pinctada imbricata]
MERWIFGILTFILLCHDNLNALDFGYHDNDKMAAFLTEVNRNYSAITKLYSAGKTVQNRDLWVLAIGKDVHAGHVMLQPHFKYVGNMHGNEVVSREVLLHLIDYYVSSYGNNATVTNFLDNTVVHIMPSMNPDGFAAAMEGDCFGVIGRQNANNYDLNRNFPDFFAVNPAPMQPETLAIMNWTRQFPFVLSANLHGGALVANYPFDNYVNASGIQKYATCPDDDTYIDLAKTYANNHANMYTGAHCGDNFPGGITNGALWYPVTGGMQDWNYIVAGCFEITLEISCCKYPNSSQLAMHWDENKQALIAFPLKVHIGIKGIVRNESGHPVAGATMIIRGRESINFTTTDHGEYWRLLLPGTYTVEVYTIIRVLVIFPRLSIPCNMFLNQNFRRIYIYCNSNCASMCSNVRGCVYRCLCPWGDD